MNTKKALRFITFLSVPTVLLIGVADFLIYPLMGYQGYSYHQFLGVCAWEYLLFLIGFMFGTLIHD